MKWSTNIAVVAVALALAGCGGDSAAEGTSQNEVDVSIANRDIALYCVEQYDGPTPGSTGYRDMLAAVETLVRVYREEPELVYTTESDGDRTMREVVADGAASLERCGDSRNAIPLDRALEAGA